MSGISRADLQPPAPAREHYESPPGYPRCARHDVLEGLYACLLCNDLSIHS